MDDENDSLHDEEQSLQHSTRQLQRSMARVDALTSARRPLIAVNTPAKALKPLCSTPEPVPSANGTPSATRDALEAVLEAVMDVLLMEHVLQLEEQAHVELDIPDCWQAVVNELLIGNDLVEDLLKAPDAEPNGASWHLCGGYFQEQLDAKKTETTPSRTILFDVDEDVDLHG